MSNLRRRLGWQRGLQLLDFIEIEIVNWAKYNPRKDYKKPWWFALSNTITTDEVFCEFTDAEFRAWIHILCTASVQNTNKPKLFFKYAERSAGIRREPLLAAMEKLKTLGVIKIPNRSRTESVPDPVATLQNRTIQNNTEQKRETPAARSPNIPIDSALELLANIPILTANAWAKKYPDSIWRNEQRERCFEFHCLDPATKPRTVGQWMKKLSTWYERGWPERKNQPQSLADVDLDAPSGGVA